MNDHGMNHATPTSDKARVTKMEEVLTAPSTGGERDNRHASKHACLFGE